MSASEQPASGLSVGDKVEVQIEKIVFGGEGLGRMPNGMILFVPFTAVGDVVQTRLVRKKSKVAWGEVISITKPGRGRQTAPCSYFQSCGGCQYQHLTYEEEVHLKQEQVKEALRREGKMLNPPVQTLIRSPMDLGYRNRLTVHAEAGIVGFHDLSGKALVDIDKCLLAEPEVNEELTRLRAEKPIDGHYALRSKDVPRSGFFQANRPLLAELRRVVEEAFQPAELLLEGYCGGGFFTEGLAKKFKRIRAVDNDPRTLKDAQRLGLKHVDWILGDAAVDFSALVLERASEGASVLVDPPREGLPETITNALLFQPVERLVYVSCDPATFSRDAQYLGKKYRLESVQPIDLFPRTSQIEVIGVWSKLP